MDLQNLKEHHEELLSFMENNGYSSTYIQRFRDEINRILDDADSNRWRSYRDIYLEYLNVPHSKDYLRNKRTIFVRFLNSRGLSPVKPPQIPRKERRAYIPHAFTQEELSRFFHECDHIPVINSRKETLICKMEKS